MKTYNTSRFLEATGNCWRLTHTTHTITKINYTKHTQRGQYLDLFWISFFWLITEKNYALSILFFIIQAMEHKFFGCKVNKYHLSQRINHLNTIPETHQNSIIIASCEVTDRAKKKYIKEIITHAENKKHIYLTGCGSISNGKKIEETTFYSRYPELKSLSQNITLLPETPPQENKKPKLSTINHQLSTISTRKPIIIQTGCDNFCTFCLTVRKRWPHQSRAAHEIIDEINTFQKAGGHEIVLTGINLAARWASDSTKADQSQFSSLLQKIIIETEIPRIRISSLWPEYLDDIFFQIIQNPRFMPHFHISIQNFSDHILKLMKRNYNTNTLTTILHNFKNTNFKQTLSLWADIITGFPGETETDFQINYEAIQNHNITKLHAFPFSPHLKGETVPASFLTHQLPKKTRELRNKKLFAHAESLRQQFIDSQKWKTFEVLLEKQIDGIRQWRSENYIELKIPWNYYKNQIITTTL